MSTPNTHHGAKRIDEMLSPDKCKRIFFCGVGGINMSSLAELSLGMGYSVAGSDRQKSELCEGLRSMGAEIFYSHAAENVEGADAFVYTVAISPDNPEYVRARELSIPRISRADYLGYIMTKYENRVGICGTHGKSSTTAMCAAIFEEAGREPTVMCGAKLGGAESPFVSGAKRDFIFEACEYMDSFLDFNPTVAVVLNVELDHVDYFNGIEQMKGSYARFVSICTEAGGAVYNADDINTVDALADFKGRRLSFGIESDADLVAKDLCERCGRFSYDMIYKGERLARVELSSVGRHSVMNSLAAAGAAIMLGVDKDAIARGLAKCGGVSRRMEYKGSFMGADFYDDYAHHPTEIRASLSAFRKMTEGRLICLFQSHTYSRTHALLDGFADALGLADAVIVAPIFSAREINESGVSQYDLAERIGDRAVACADLCECEAVIKETVREGDTVVLMGAGDAPKMLKNFELVKKS